MSKKLIALVVGVSLALGFSIGVVTAQVTGTQWEASGPCISSPTDIRCDITIVPPASTTTAPATTTTSTSAPATTTTTTAPAPSTSTSTTVPPTVVTSTTAAPTTTRAPTTTSATTTTAPSPTTTSPSGGVQFSETFENPSAFLTRFDHAWSGQWDAGAAWGGNANDWPGDHDMACGNPNTTSRTIHLSSQQQANDAAFYACLPADDPAKGHLMTTVNTEGYVIAWFSPKQTFSNVKRVCWDQNIQDLGGGKWNQVIFATMTEANARPGDLGFVSPEFADPNGPGTSAGPASHGVKLEGGSMVSWSSLGEWNEFKPNTVQRRFGGNVGVTTDKAPRYRQCVVDNENGTLTATRTGPSGTVTSSVQGEIPNGQIRVVFEDDNYNPDKHNGASGVPRNSGQGYTWHWDNIEVA